MDERRNYLSVAAAALKAQHLALEHRQPRVSRGLTPLPGLLGSRLEGPSGKGDHVPQMRTPPRMRTPEPRGRPRSPQATAEHEPCLPSAVTEPVAPPLAPPVAPAGVPMEATAPRPPAAALETCRRYLCEGGRRFLRRNHPGTSGVNRMHKQRQKGLLQRRSRLAEEDIFVKAAEGYDEESEEEEAERTAESGRDLRFARSFGGTTQELPGSTGCTSSGRKDMAI
eukprot:s1005_g35.t3